MTKWGVQFNPVWDLMITFDKTMHSRPLGAFIKSEVKEHVYIGTLISLETPDD